MEPTSLSLILLAGFGLGLLFYGGLWITVRALPESRHAVVLALGSFWGRTAATTAGVVVLADGRWENALVCVAGFAAARVVVARWISAASARQGTR